MKYVLPLLAGTLLSTPALALDDCKAGDDPQQRICTYDPSQRYVVREIVGYPVNLTFASDEAIKRFDPAYTGKSPDGTPAATWRGPKCKDTSGKDQECSADKFLNNLPIWPFHSGHSSALVTTTKNSDGNKSERTYMLDLTAIPAKDDCSNSSDTNSKVASLGPVETPKPDRTGCPDDPNLTTSLAFVYPTDEAAAKKKQTEDQRQASVAAWRQRQVNKKEQEAKEKLLLDPLTCPVGGCNSDYTARGDKQYAYLAPSRIWDNGNYTVMIWPANVAVPSVAILDPGTQEPRIAPIYSSKLIPSSGQVMVYTGTAPSFRLSMGQKAVLDIINKKWSPNRPDPGTGSTRPDVIETVIQAKQ